MRAENFQKTSLGLEGWMVTVTSYCLGDRYIAEVEAVASGVTMSRATAEARATAEEEAVNTAVKRLGRTRRIDINPSAGG